MESALLLDVVVGESTSIFQLFSSEDQSLLVWGNSFLVLDLCFYIFNGVRWFNLQSDCLAGEGLDKDLHTSSQTEHKMESALLLDVVVGESTSIFQLFSSEDQSLLVWWNSFLVLDLCFYIFNGVRWFNLQSNGLASEGLEKNLHSTSETKNKMKSAL